MINQDQYDVLFQNSRVLYIRVNLLNTNNKKIDEISGVATGGSISLDGNSSIRRTCDVSLVMKDSTFSIGDDKKIWLDKRAHIEIGLEGFSQGEVVWFDMGKYLINQPSISHNAIDNTLSFSGVDLMAIFDGKRGGVLSSKVVIDEGTPIHEAVKMTVKTLGKYPNVIIESSERTAPYKIEKSAGDTVESLIKELADLYMDMEYYIDINGNFIYQRIRNKINDPVMLDFTQMPQDLTIGYTLNHDFEGVKNSILTMGKLRDDGVQIMHRSQITDKNNPFSIYSSIGIVEDVYNDDKVFTLEQAKARSDYELYLHSNLKQSASISCVPIYGIDMNRVIYLDKQELGLEGRFLVVGARIPLSIDGEMSMEVVKQYDPL